MSAPRIEPAETSREMSRIELDPQAAARRKEALRQDFETRRIPLLRCLGFGLLSLAIPLYNRFLGDSGPEATRLAIGYATLATAYCALSWLVLRTWYHRTKDTFDLGLVFLLLDLIPLVGAVYATGGETSWMVALLMLRTADQAPTSFRRSLLFAHATVLSYFLLVAYLDLVEARPILWLEELTKCALIYAANLYIAVTARGSDVQKSKMAQAIRLSRDLIARLRSSKAELARASARAEAANEAKGQFLANMSHEIRTPMNGIVGLSDLLLRDGLPPPQQEKIRLISSSAGDLLRVIDDVLDFARIEAGRLALLPSPFVPVDLLREVAALLEPRARDKGLRLEVAATGSEVPRRVLADRVRLRQILVNLVGNAVKFTAEGTIELRVSATSRPENRLRFEVRDQGPGLSEAEMQNIFEPFSQADLTMSRQHGGVGLGLPISRQLAELMGGNLEVESRVGSGSTFRVELPCVEPPEAETTGEPEDDLPAPLPGAGDLHLLLVEDNAVNRLVAREMLRGLGFRVSECAGGTEALEAMGRESFDLILMDCQMPGLDGYQTTREIRRREEGSGRHVPILALTAHALESDKQRCTEAGMDGHLTKPIRLATLASEIRAWLPAAGKPADD